MYRVPGSGEAGTSLRQEQITYPAGDESAAPQWHVREPYEAATEGGREGREGYPVPPRVEALVSLLGQLGPESRDAIIADAFARATTAHQMTALREAISALQEECRRAS